MWERNVATSQTLMLSLYYYLIETNPTSKFVSCAMSGTITLISLNGISLQYMLGFRVIRNEIHKKMCIFSMHCCPETWFERWNEVKKKFAKLNSYANWKATTIELKKYNKQNSILFTHANAILFSVQPYTFNVISNFVIKRFDYYMFYVL